MTTTIEEQCAQLLKDLRRKKGLTLHEFEELSGGEVKAVVLGSYERGTRAISLARLQQLAELYEVPIEYFFNRSQTQSDIKEMQLVFDLRRIRGLENLEPALTMVKVYLAAISAKRNDWNGEVISLRADDSKFLAIINNLDIADFAQQLRLTGFLFASEVSAQRSL
jgi:transcriptional regulator with XRE-family HTH domain